MYKNGRLWLGLGLVAYAAAGISAAPVVAPGWRAGLGELEGTFKLRDQPGSLAKASASGLAHPLPRPENRIRAMAQVNPNFDPSQLAKLGWALVSSRGGFAVMEGDIRTFHRLHAVTGISVVQLSRQVRPKMDEARRLSRVDGLLSVGPKAAPPGKGYSGKGVLIGIVDYDFDISHPAFLDARGKTRFIGIWNQGLPSDGTAAYGGGQVKMGTELETHTAFGRHPGEFHGTYVASLASGSDFSSAFYGMAPEAKLVAVDLNPGDDTSQSAAEALGNMESSVMDGIQWIFHVADSLRMPCVVNLSLGLDWGPHDGTSVFDRFLDATVAKGRLVVGAAGNANRDRQHILFHLKPNDTLGTFLSSDYDGDTVANIPKDLAAADFWGEPGKPFAFKVLLKRTESAKYLVAHEYLSTLTGKGEIISDTLLFASGFLAMDSVLIQTTFEKAASENQRPHANVAIKFPTGTFQPALLFTGAGEVHGWTPVPGGFKAEANGAFLNGDAEYMINEMGGTSKSILAVGAYVSKPTFRNAKGLTMGDDPAPPTGSLADFSSAGPTLDGRRKPDLSAPGSHVVGAMSTSADLEDKFISSILVNPATPKSGAYFALEGTSASAPIVAGAVALMLEANPKLTPEQARAILTSTAYHDAMTGTVPDNHWGAGKLDASAAVRKAADPQLVALSPPSGDAVRPHFRLMGNRLAITGLPAGDFRARLEVHDLAGSEVYTVESRDGREFLLGSGLQPGVYLAVVKAGGMKRRFRFLYP